MKFPEKIYPHLYKLEEMEFSSPKENSWEYRREYKDILWKEYRHRLHFIEYRLVELGGDKGVHGVGNI